jgi:hypothetical protein
MTEISRVTAHSHLDSTTTLELPMRRHVKASLRRSVQRQKTILACQGKKRSCILELVERDKEFTLMVMTS